MKKIAIKYDKTSNASFFHISPLLLNGEMIDITSWASRDLYFDNKNKISTFHSNNAKNLRHDFTYDGWNFFICSYLFNEKCIYLGWRYSLPQYTHKFENLTYCKFLFPNHFSINPDHIIHCDNLVIHWWNKI